MLITPVMFVVFTTELTKLLFATNKLLGHISAALVLSAVTVRGVSAPKTDSTLTKTKTRNALSVFM
jgi:hypothetical protein